MVIFITTQSVKNPPKLNKSKAKNDDWLSKKNINDSTTQRLDSTRLKSCRSTVGWSTVEFCRHPSWSSRLNAIQRKWQRHVNHSTSDRGFLGNATTWKFLLRPTRLKRFVFWVFDYSRFFKVVKLVTDVLIYSFIYIIYLNPPKGVKFEPLDYQKQT